jgi:hypothetical protein
VAKRMQLLNDSKIRILSEDNLDTILSFEKTADCRDAVPKIESICKMDNMPDKILDKHIFVDQRQMKKEETMTRLMRCMRFHKTWLKHGKELLKNRERVDYKPSKFDIFKYMYTVDYSDSPNKPNSTFFLQQSFSILDWMITEKIMKKGT